MNSHRSRQYKISRKSVYFESRWYMRRGR